VSIPCTHLHYTVSFTQDSLVELGIALLSQEEYEESIEVFQEALAMREKEAAGLQPDERGKVKLHIAKILNNIGCANFEFGELDDAKEAFEEVLTIQQDCFDAGDFSSMPGYLATSSTICNLGCVYLEKADWEKAIFQLEEGLKIQQNVLEPTNAVIMTTLEHIAYANIKYGCFDKAVIVSTSISLHEFICASAKMKRPHTFFPTISTTRTCITS